MNTSFYAIIYPFIHKMCLNCYLRYILPSEIESFLSAESDQGLHSLLTECTFRTYFLRKVYVPSHSFHEGLGHDLIFIGIKHISFLI